LKNSGSAWEGGYVFGAEFDGGGDDDSSLFDVFVLDEGVSFGEVVLDDHELFVGEGEIDGLCLFVAGVLDGRGLP
jgi:hypothetical protein